MAKLKVFEQVTKKSDGDRIKWRGDIYVSAQGIFYVTIPEDLMGLATNLEKEVGDFKKFHIKGGKFYTDTLADCEKFIKQIHHKKAILEKKEEIFIYYKFNNCGSYWKNEDGTVLPSGGSVGSDYYEKTTLVKSGWIGDLDATHCAKSYSIEFYAKIAKKITYSGSDKIDFTGVSKNELGNYGEAMNSFVGLKYPSEDRYFDDMYFKNMKEVPYTEERAKFFYDLFLGMCKLMDKLSCLQDEDILKRLMESNTKLLD